MLKTITQLKTEIFEVEQQFILLSDEIDQDIKKEIEGSLLDKLELLNYQKLELEFGVVEN